MFVFSSSVVIHLCPVWTYKQRSLHTLIQLTCNQFGHASASDALPKQAPQAVLPGRSPGQHPTFCLLSAWLQNLQCLQFLAAVKTETADGEAQPAQTFPASTLHDKNRLPTCCSAPALTPPLLVVGACNGDQHAHECPRLALTSWQTFRLGSHFASMIAFHANVQAG